MAESNTRSIGHRSGMTPAELNRKIAKGHSSRMTSSTEVMGGDVVEVLEPMPPVALVGDYGLAKEYRAAGLWELIDHKLDFDKVGKSDDYYYCPSCPHRTSKRYELNKHNQNHVKPYRCLRCDFGAAQLKDVVRHINGVHRSDFDMCNIEDFNCRWCGKIFKRKDGRNRHEGTCMDGELVGEAPNQAVEMANRARIRRSLAPVPPTYLDKGLTGGLVVIAGVGDGAIPPAIKEEEEEIREALPVPELMSEERVIVGADRVLGTRKEQRFFELRLGQCDEAITINLAAEGQATLSGGVTVTPSGCTFTVIGEGDLEHKVNLLFPVSDPK